MRLSDIIDVRFPHWSLEFYNVKSMSRIHIHVRGNDNLYLPLHFGDLIWHPLFTIATQIELKFITIGIC